MPRFTKEVDGRNLIIETAVPREAAELRAQGFAEQEARTTAVKGVEAKQAEAPKTSK